MSVRECTTVMPSQTTPALTWAYVPEVYAWDDTSGHHEFTIWKFRRVA